ncbi:NADAR family protein [Streptomyces sp. TLI_55]|uniref:NADAR family protein n=1 Tax=Streptomyces sp. TLI_55 TaxID=1938861 RepID=UPI00211C221F|nr:NADAR family protein [Streptomyces sp. TLI_55]
MIRDASKLLRRDWERVKDDVMRRAVATKFRAHDDIRQILLSTDDEEIVEDTTTDHYWGQGRSGNGKNMLGKILMRTRSRLRTERAEAHDGDSRTWPLRLRHDGERSTRPPPSRRRAP